MRAVPLFNHLLVLWDRSVTALNMFSLEPVPALKRIQHVSLFEVGASSPAAEMVTASSRKRVIRIHVVGVDRWDVVKEVPLLQDAVALAVDGRSLCVATSDKYLLCDMDNGGCVELLRHDHSRQRVIVTAVGRGEFLLNGPGSLGTFVMKTGICQRPPLQWPQEMLAVAVCFPYVLTLQPRGLSVYSMLDQQHKQALSLSGAKGLLSTSESDIFSLRLVPLEEQVQALVRHERIHEALLLLDGVQSRRPCDSYKELHRSITCLAGFVHFYRQDFSEARDLFIEGELDPREIIRLYPDMESGLGGNFQSFGGQRNKGGDLRVLWREDRDASARYLAFLGDFLRAVRGTAQGLECGKEVDCALLRLYAEQGDAESLQRFVASPNACSLDRCVPFLEQHQRFFALGLLYQSHGKQIEAIKTWVMIADGCHKDPSCPDAYEHIVWTLSQLRDRDAVWTFAGWTLRRNQETGVRIFTRRPPDDYFEARDVLDLLEKHPTALLLYLEFLIHNLNSEERRHHSRLALAYVNQATQRRGETNTSTSRRKLQQLLWESRFYDISTVYDRVKSTDLHLERAILIGKTGGHSQALQLLVRETRDPEVAEAYCRKAASGLGSQFEETLLLGLLEVYLSFEDLTAAAVDLLNRNAEAFAAEKVLRLLPESWSLQLVSRFLVGSLRETVHQRRMKMVQRALGQAELLRHKVMWMQASKTKFRVDKGQRCAVCQGAFAEPQLACSLLLSEPVHASCAGSAS